MRIVHAEKSWCMFNSLFIKGVQRAEVGLLIHRRRALALPLHLREVVLVDPCFMLSRPPFLLLKPTRKRCNPV